MAALRTVSVLVDALIWRSARIQPAGRRLVDALNGDEQTRTLAGMALVQGGERSVPLLADAITATGPTKMIVRVLADIGGEGAKRELEGVAAGTGEVADLARELATM